MNISNKRIKNIHFIGIGGSGMSGIAEVLINLGYEVTGSDIQDSKVIQRLKSIGADIQLKHNRKNLKVTELVVISSAIDSSNEEIIEAREKGIPILSRAEMLSSLMNMKKGIAVAGTHGKTTTTSMLASILTEAKYDPTFIVGGILNKFSTNAKLGKGEYLVAEADESDGSFLKLQPSLSIITNIENDHLSNYGNKYSNLKKAFIDFAKKIPFDGFLVACGDDPTIKELIPRFSRKVITYGFNTDNDFVINNYLPDGFRSEFLVYRGKKPLFEVKLNMVGKHNALNAVAAAVLALEEGVKIEIIQSALDAFKGIGRRMELLGLVKRRDSSFLMVDDYGHHPTEIRSTIEAIRESCPDSRVIMIFQPHRYSRTKDLFNEFIKTLKLVDELLILDIYAAGEKKIRGCTSKSLAKSLRNQTSIPIHLPKNLEEIVTTLKDSLTSHKSVLLTQGAGDIASLSKTLYKKFST